MKSCFVQNTHFRYTGGQSFQEYIPKKEEAD